MKLELGNILLINRSFNLGDLRQVKLRKKLRASARSQFTLVYITMPSEVQAKEMARALLEGRLIVCATILPCQSMYWWDGAIQSDQEVIMFVKTVDDKFEQLQQVVTKLHSYQVPCILKIDAIANAPYAQWVQAELALSRSAD